MVGEEPLRAKRVACAPEVAPFGFRRGGRGPRQTSSPMHQASPSSIFLVRARHTATQTNIMARKASLVSRRGKGRGRLGWGVGGRSGLSSEMTNGWTFVVGGEEEDGARGVWWWRFWGFSGGWVGLPGRLGGGFGIFGDTSDFPRKMAGGFPVQDKGGSRRRERGR